MHSARGLLLGCLLLVGGFASAAEQGGWVDFQIVNGMVVVPTEVQGIAGFSAVDTGAQFTGIEQSFIDKQGLKLLQTKPIKISGLSGTQTRKVYTKVPVKLLGAELVFDQLVSLSLNPRGQLLIGGDFLRGIYVQFDYPNKRLRAIPRSAFDLKKLSNVKSKIDPKTRQPMVKVRLNDEQDQWLVIDTGNSMGVVMERRIPKKRGWLEKFPAEEQVVRGVIEMSATEVFRLPQIEVGPYLVKNARVTVPAQGQSFDMFKQAPGASGLRSKARGLVGYDVLKNFVVTFDYQTGAMFIELPKASSES